MSRRPKRRGLTVGAGCAGKRSYGTAEEAWAVVRRKIEQGAAVQAQNAYECRHCGAWHEGHVRGSNRKR